MLVVLLKIIFVFACFLLVLAVLLQQGKGGGISGAFGIGGASQTLFGASGAGNFLTKSTWVLGGTFMLLSLLLAMLSGTGPGNVRRSVLEPTGATAPATPGAAPGSALPGTAPATPAAGAPAGTAPATSPATTPVTPAPGTGTGTAGGTGN